MVSNKHNHATRRCIVPRVLHKQPGSTLGAHTGWLQNRRSLQIWQPACCLALCLESSLPGDGPACAPGPLVAGCHWQSSPCHRCSCFSAQKQSMMGCKHEAQTCSCLLDPSMLHPRKQPASFMAACHTSFSLPAPACVSALPLLSAHCMSSQLAAGLHTACGTPGAPSLCPCLRVISSMCDGQPTSLKSGEPRLACTSLRVSFSSSLSLSLLGSTVTPPLAPAV